MVVCSTLPKDKGTDKSPDLPDAPEEVPTYQAFVSRHFLGTACSTHQVNEVTEILLDLLRRQAPHQIQGTIQLLVTLQEQEEPWSQGGQETQHTAPSSQQQHALH